MAIIKTITLYHDGYETRNGDGFYPSAIPHECWEEIEVQFQFVPDGYWYQVSEYNIKGFDGNERSNILKLLNDEKYNSNRIVSRLGY